MAGLGTPATSLITTRGLFVSAAIAPGYTALSYGTLITPWFRLYIDENAPKPPNYVAAVGSRVYAPGEFEQSWKFIDPVTGQQIGGPTLEVPGPTADEPWLVVPYDRESEYFGESGKIVTIKFNFAGKEHEKIYKVSDKQSKRIIEVINFVNATRSRIDVSISGIKRVATRALVEVRNFRLRKKRTKY